MYIILVYDAHSDRVAKFLKLCRRYLHWIQNSVFEGELSAVQLLALKKDLQALMDPSYDSVLIFSSRDSNWLNKEVLGIERNDTGQFL